MTTGYFEWATRCLDCAHLKPYVSELAARRAYATDKAYEDGVDMGHQIELLRRPVAEWEVVSDGYQSRPPLGEVKP